MRGEEGGWSLGCRSCTQRRCTAEGIGCLWSREGEGEAVLVRGSVSVSVIESESVCECKCKCKCECKCESGRRSG
jgi:hypothetical protein